MAPRAAILELRITRPDVNVSDLEARLRQLVRLSDPDGTVTIRWLAALIGVCLEDDSGGVEAAASDLNVADVADHFKRSVSTVRGWLGRRELRGYKLNGRDWRVPRSAIREYEERQQQLPAQTDQVDIREWRVL